MKILDFIESSNATGSPEALVEGFRAVLGEEGFDGFAYGVLSAGDSRPEGPAILVEYPRDWIEHYMENALYLVDPVMSQTPYMRRPFTWGEFRDLSETQQTFMHEADDAGLKQGFTVPIHAPFGDVYVMSVSSSDREPLDLGRLNRLHLLTVQFHTAYGRTQEFYSEPVRLTPRERECLLWSAQGKSSWDIGMILNLSEHTVNFHIKNAMRKLGATSRILAIVKAIRIGLIVP